MTKFLLDVNDEIWVEFKKKLSKDKSINDHLIDMIKREISGQ